MAEDWEPRWYRRRGWPFFGSWFARDVDELFKETERMIEEEFKELSKRAPKNLVRERIMPDGSRVREWGPFVYGYSITIDSDGKPRIKEFGNIRMETRAGKPLLDVTERREPLVDVITTDKDIKVIAELPGVQREDIRLKGTAETLTISVDTPERKFFKEVELPAKVDVKNAKSTYKNGVLEVTLPKIGEKEPEGEHIKIE
ncbi:MAG: archaeal heat shock protein Hsp20 [Nitrososphaeria archaeon]